MLVAVGGGGAGSTPWAMMTMQQMQAHIQNPDTERHYELLTGWKQSADLLVEHQWQVRNYRDNLAAVWPPEKNAASAAYIARLDELLANLTETYEAAISNHDAFAAATLSLSLAQKDMEEIAREYQSNELLLTDFTAKQQTTSGQPQPSPSPSGEQPPVAPGRQEELYQRAVNLLNGVSADLALAQVNIRTPRPYTPENRRDDPTGSDSGTYVAPPIPPITAGSELDSSSPSSSQRPSVNFPTSSLVTTPPLPQPPTPQPGLILGGANSPTATIPPSGLASASPATPIGPAGPPLGPGLIAPSSNSFARGGSAAALPTGGPIGRNTALPREGAIRQGVLNPKGTQALPSGGVIGGVPGGSLGNPGSSRPTSQRVNPIGGVIEGGPPSSRGVTSNTPVQQLAGGGPYGQQGRSAARRGEEDQSRWDPDNPWRTASGVDPVVLPPRKQQIDPGPAIGLS